MKSAGVVMEILDAYDLTGSYRDAAELVGVSHHTVRRYVEERARLGEVQAQGLVIARAKKIDGFVEKVEEWVERSDGKVRADVVHEKLMAMGYTGSERATRREVAAVKKAYAAGRVRVHRPWVTEPGMWLQYDYGHGPKVAGEATVLFCAWLAWSRYRVILPLRDKTLPSVFAALDATFRLVGGVPTYVLTDNEKTVTTMQVAGLPVRHPQLVEWSRHYGVVVHTCRPADPASKGGSENAVKIAKADLVPTEANLLEEYDSFADLQAACSHRMSEFNDRVHRTTKRRPIEMLAEERARLHPVPLAAHTVAFGTTRKVPPNTPMVAFESGQYSVPSHLLGATVWVRVHGVGCDEQVVITALDERGGPVEVARHDRARPGSPAIDDAHFPPAPPGALERVPHAQNATEAAFLAIGPGAATWLSEAAASGASRITAKINDAITLAKLFDAKEVDWALGHAAIHGRFAEGDLAAILDHHRNATPSPKPLVATEQASLTQGTSGWAQFGLFDLPGQVVA